MGEWPTQALGDLCAKERFAIAIGPFGSRMKADCYVSAGVKVIRGTNISTEKIWNGNWVYVSEEFASGLPNCLVRAGDLVLPHRGAIGEVGLVPDDGNAYLISTSLMKITLDSVWASSEFIFYYLRSDAGRHEILRFGSQVGTPGIGQPLTSLRQFRVPVPPIHQQRAIAAVLSALDDKIELSRRMNETLEASAQALFRDWFIDYGPTRAKMEGRPAYLAPDLWSLFPDRLDDDGKPDGWAWGTLGDVARSVNAKVEPNDIDPDTPYIGLEHMPRQSVALHEWEGAGKVSSAKNGFKAGQILFGKLRPYFHKVGVAPIDGICSTDIVVMEAKQTRHAALLLACASTEDFVAFTDKGSTGTKMPRTSWPIMSGYRLIKPERRIAEQFEFVAGAMYAQIIANIHQSRTLAETRDLLLPKLMSGEIRVRDAQKLAGEGL